MPFDQLPLSRAVANVVGVGADIASAGVTPQAQAGAMAVNIVITNFVDPGGAGAFSAIVQTRRTGATDWVSLTSSRNNEINGNGTFTIVVVDPILDDVRVFFDVNGQTFTAAIDFEADTTLAAAA